MKLLRDYFEDGCLCIRDGKVVVDTTETDDEASKRYIRECKCTRHPEGLDE